MLQYLKTNNWEEAFYAVMPKRKLIDSQPVVNNAATKSAEE
jgi:hypothetical protein